LPSTLNKTLATFTDDRAVLAVGGIVENSTRKLQSAVNKVAICTKDWQIKL
jgi:hypothetical protein